MKKIVYLLCIVTNKGIEFKYAYEDKALAEKGVELMKDIYHAVAFVKEIEIIEHFEL